jgi:hypothetical protein
MKNDSYASLSDLKVHACLLSNWTGTSTLDFLSLTILIALVKTQIPLHMYGHL